MKVAKLFHAANSPLQNSKTIHCRGRQLKVSSHHDVIWSDGSFIGCTTLHKTNELNVDRVQIGNMFYEVYHIGQYDYNAVKYCICVDDVENKWLQVFPTSYLESLAVITDKASSSANHLKDKELNGSDLPTYLRSKSNRNFPLNGKTGKILVVCLTIAIIAYIGLSHKSIIKNTVKEITTEQVSKEVKKGESKTYTFGARVNDTQTAEDIVNSQIAADHDDAEKERAGIASITAEGTEFKVQSNNTTEGNPKKKSNKTTTASETNNDTESASEEPFSSISDTVITPQSSNEPNTQDDLAEVFSPGIGDITISEKNPDFTITNPTEQTMTFSMSAGQDKIFSVTVKAGDSESLDILDRIKETTKASVKYTFKNSVGETVRVISGKITVYVL